jgi:serine/threonine protein kinase
VNVCRLCGFPPFYGNDEEEVYVKTETCDYSYPAEYWGGISDRAKDLIDNLLTLDLKKRLSARQALQHPWIASEQSTTHLETALVGLKRFEAKRKFRVCANYHYYYYNTYFVTRSLTMHTCVLLDCRVLSKVFWPSTRCAA